MLQVEPADLWAVVRMGWFEALAGRFESAEKSLKKVRWPETPIRDITHCRQSGSIYVYFKDFLSFFQSRQYCIILCNSHFFYIFFFKF